MLSALILLVISDVGNFTGYYSLYKNLSDISSDYKVVFPIRDWTLQTLLSQQARRDEFLSLKSRSLRSDVMLYTQILQGDTLGIGILAEEGKEIRPGREGGHRNGELLLSYAKNITGWLKYNTSTVFGERTFFSDDAQDNNDGVNTSHIFTTRISTFWTELEERRLTKKREIGGKVSTVDDLLQVETKSVNLVYPVTSGEEEKEIIAFNTTVSPKTHFMGSDIKLSATLTGDKTDYKLDILGRKKEISGELGSTLRTATGPLELTFNIAKGVTNKDFIEFAGDETKETNRMSYTFLWSFSTAHSIEINGDITMLRYSYPQNVRKDDRDEFDRSGGLRSVLRIASNTELDIRFDIHLRDILYLKSTRSIQSQTKEYYLLESVVRKGGILNLSNKITLSAAYHKFRFNPQNNILIRYIQDELNLSKVVEKNGIDILYRIKFQDQGLYLKLTEEGWTYFKNMEIIEHFLSPTLYMGVPWGYQLGIIFETYLRYSGIPQEEKILSQTETAWGFEIRDNDVYVSYKRHKRKGEKTFSNVMLNYQVSF